MKLQPTSWKTIKEKHAFRMTKGELSNTFLNSKIDEADKIYFPVSPFSFSHC